MLQDFADQLSAQGLSASSVRNTLLPLRAIFRRAHRRGEVAVNPTVKLALPAVSGQRNRVAAPTELGPLLDALQPAERAIYATALYAGLRARRTASAAMGRHRPARKPHPRHRSWDRQHGFVAPKSRSGTRRVPITPTLRRELINHRLQQGTGGNGFVFPSTARPSRSTPARLKLHTTKAWTTAGLTPIGLHECRHSYAAYMIAAGVNSKALSTYMGHSSITITLDRYGHLLPGNETEAADAPRNLAQTPSGVSNSRASEGTAPRSPSRHLYITRQYSDRVGGSVPSPQIANVFPGGARRRRDGIRPPPPVLVRPFIPRRT